MAIWQFEIRLEPQRTIHASAGGMAVPPADETSFAIPLQEVVRWLDDRFPRSPSWSDSVIGWGEESGHRVQLVQQDSRITSLVARIDLRQPGRDFVRQLFDLATLCEGEWLTVDDQRLEPTLTSFKDAIWKSPSYTFVIDPHEFLAELGSE